VLPEPRRSTYNGLQNHAIAADIRPIRNSHDAIRRLAGRRLVWQLPKLPAQMIFPETVIPPR
jgi:hypothetical protein